MKPAIAALAVLAALYALGLLFPGRTREPQPDDDVDEYTPMAAWMPSEVSASGATVNAWRN